jgi:hypothetical protein
MLARTRLVVLSLLGSASLAHGAPETRIGVMADVGLPDGANASLVVRPIRMLRLHAGGGHNYISPGVRGGITFVPFATWITPTLSVDYGRYFDGDANPLARMVSGDSSFSSTVLDHVGYDYGNAHVGIELGRTRATFYIHAGMSRITGNIRGLNAMAGGMSGDSGTSITFADDPRVELWTVSARVGLVVYIH